MFTECYVCGWQIRNAVWCDGLCIVRGWLEKALERARYVGD